MKVPGLLLAIFAGCATLPTLADDCPDLTGTYEVRIPEWADKLHPFGQRVRMQTRQFATFQRQGTGYTLIWHASRPEFLAAARALAQRDSSRYDEWLDMIVRDPKRPLPLDVDGERDWVGRTASVGLAFRGIDQALPLKQCKRGMFLVFGPGRREGPPDFAGGRDGTRELAIWLGRDKDGSLGLSVEERKTLELTRPSKYASEIAIPLWSSARVVETWPAAPAQDLTPIRAAELPGRSRALPPIPKCQVMGDPEALFFQRLKANLPRDVAIENKSSTIDQGRVRPDGTCEPLPFSVTVSAPNAADIARVEAYLRTDPFVREITSQEKLNASWVRFRMMVSP